MPINTMIFIGNWQFPWTTETHVAEALEDIGVRVFRQPEVRLDWRKLPEIVRQYKAQMVLWQRTWLVNVGPDALKACGTLSAEGVPVVSYHLDRFFGLEREKLIRTDPFFRTDLLVTPDDGPWGDYGIQHVWMPPGVAHNECLGGTPNPRYPEPIVFVGSHPYPHKEWEPVRTGLIEAVRQRYGDDFAVWPKKGQPPIRNKALADLYASAKVVIGDSCLLGNPRRYWSDRVTETLGRRGLLLHPRVSGMEDWYEHERDLLLYEVGDHDEVLRLIDWALAHPEEADMIRTQGQNTVLGRDTYHHRMRAVLAAVEERFTFARPKSVTSVGPVSVLWKRSNAVSAKLYHTNTLGVLDGIREVWQADDYRMVPADVRGGTVIDIGANMGAFTVLAAKLGAAKVFAYEPVPEHVEVIEKNVATNGVNGCEVVQAAVVGTPTAKLVLAGAGGGVHAASEAERATATLEVPTVGINDILAAAKTVALLKIDIEGGEYDVIAGLDTALLPRVARIVMEFHGPGMPHLVHLNADGLHEQRWADMITKLAKHGSIEVKGRPGVGGLLYWSRY